MNDKNNNNYKNAMREVKIHIKKRSEMFVRGLIIFHYRDTSEENAEKNVIPIDRCPSKRKNSKKNQRFTCVAAIACGIAHHKHLLDNQEAIPNRFLIFQFNVLFN